MLWKEQGQRLGRPELGSGQVARSCVIVCIFLYTLVPVSHWVKFEGLISKAPPHPKFLFILHLIKGDKTPLGWNVLSDQHVFPGCPAGGQQPCARARFYEDRMRCSPPAVKSLFSGKGKFGHLLGQEWQRGTAASLIAFALRSQGKCQITLYPPLPIFLRRCGVSQLSTSAQRVLLSLGDDSKL